MSDNFFEESTNAAGAIVTVILLGTIISILMWG